LAAAINNIWAFDYAYEELKSDKELVLEVANKSDNSDILLDLVDEDLKSDQEIISAIFRKCPEIASS